VYVNIFDNVHITTCLRTVFAIIQTYITKEIVGINALIIKHMFSPTHLNTQLV